MYYLCKRFQGEIELLIAKFQKQGRSLAKGFCHQKKEFFEKIYINREVVQEARHIAICVLGRRNEPINSSNVNEGFKEWSFCFLAFLFCYFQFTFLLLNQGDSFWTDYSRYEDGGLRFILFLFYLFTFSNLFYNGEFDPGSGWTLATGLTHASRGETALSACTEWTSTGARVSNAYPTFPLLWDNLPKGRLIPHSLRWRHQIWSKDLSVMDGDASD